MSADNQIVVQFFQKENGEQVWRVFESTLSGHEYEAYTKLKGAPQGVYVLYGKSSEITNYKEFKTYDEALEEAEIWEGSLDVCEYGVQVMNYHTAVTLEDLRQEALNAGYDV